eukprot:scaffold17041_cov88-Skeletonema_marinoi.AAC.2
MFIRRIVDSRQVPVSSLQLPSVLFTSRQSLHFPSVLFNLFTSRNFPVTKLNFLTISPNTRKLLTRVTDDASSAGVLQHSSPQQDAASCSCLQDGVPTILMTDGVFHPRQSYISTLDPRIHSVICLLYLRPAR